MYFGGGESLNKKKGLVKDWLVLSGILFTIIMFFTAWYYDIDSKIAASVSSIVIACISIFITLKIGWNDEEESE